MMTTLLCLLVLALVLPFALLLPLVIAGVVVVAVLLVVAGVLATVFSPLIVLALCIWLLVKLLRGSPRSHPRNSTSAGATMAG
jgi:hypothetical protein